MPAATWSGSCALPASAATGPTPAARSTRCGPCSSPTCTPTNLIDLNNVLSAGIYNGPDLPIPVEHLAHPNRDPRPRMSPVRFQTDDRVHVSATFVQHAPMFGRHGRRACSGTVGAHTAVEQVAPIACAAGVGTLVLSYLVPGNWPEERWDRARGDFTGRFIVGKDLAVVDVSA